ncbi:hypothetical protein ABIA33_003041 [Streptacidiphilus sp. MAP12-16]|uniref:hypothetical protein n=1 Tax=Streptacidiphilus sp. MAP12-16 TaxID=3156300 RepID=UPI0035173FD2
MRAKRFVCAMAAAGAVVLVASPTASADDGARGRVTVQPSSVDPGDTVWVFDGGQCHTKEAVATSEAFWQPIELEHRDDGILAGKGKISPTAEPEKYDVWVKCGDEKFKGWVWVKKGDDRPHGGVSTGSGGAIAGTNSAEMAAGASLLAGSAGAGALMMRRRRAGGAV